MSAAKKLKVSGIDDVEAVELFAEFLRFETVSSTGHLNGANVKCAEFLQKICTRIGLAVEILEGPAPGPKPVVAARWAGSDPAQPAILLNSHYDVVPTMAEHWTRPTFEGHIEDVDGETRIYGRGAQDMKLVCIQYLVAVSRLKAGGMVPAQDVFLTFVPDEETGGTGMAWLLDCDYYKTNMEGRIGCAFDEGLANTGDAFTTFYGERSPWWVLVDAKGPTGHGSRFIKGTATHALNGFIKRALEFRKAQEKELWSNAPSKDGGCGHAKCKKLGDVTTVNLTMQKAGVSTDGGQTYAINVIPTEASAGFDIRVPLGMPHATLCKKFDQWCREAEQEWEAEKGSLSWRFAPYGGVALQKHHTTSIDPAENKYFAKFKAAIEDDLGIPLETEVFPAGTDSRFLRALKIPCFGFSPMRRCPILLHEHDEYVPQNVFLEGPTVYIALLTRLLA